MKKAMVYIAEDGTQFEDEKSCLSYEKTLTLSKCYGFEFTKSIGFFDINEEIPFFRPVEECNIEDSDIIYTDEKGIEKLSCIMNVGGLKANSICVYDYQELWWYRLEDIIKMYEEKLSELNKLLSNVGRLIKT